MSSYGMYVGGKDTCGFTQATTGMHRCPWQHMMNSRWLQVRPYSVAKQGHMAWSYLLVLICWATLWESMVHKECQRHTHVFAADTSASCSSSSSAAAERPLMQAVISAQVCSAITRQS